MLLDEVEMSSFEILAALDPKNAHASDRFRCTGLCAQFPLRKLLRKCLLCSLFAVIMFGTALS